MAGLVWTAWITWGPAGARRLATNQPTNQPIQVVEVSLPEARGRLTAFVTVGRSLGLLCAGLLTYGFGSQRDGGWRFVHVW